MRRETAQNEIFKDLGHPSGKKGGAAMSTIKIIVMGVGELLWMGF